MSINKSDIAKNIAFETSISKKDSHSLVSRLISIISTNSIDKNVKIAKFGVFKNKLTPQRIGRNPQTGQEYIIKKRNTVKFYPSSKIKKIFN
tara:strand:- start:53 stop:328 length:276 start_codon:yes stop_codon:yes gene_type:complete